VILLTSTGQRGDGQMFAGMGFAGYLLKPVTQRDLSECLMLVSAKSAEMWHSQTQPIVTRHQVLAQRSRSRNHILLAEDNVVNQKVAMHLLERMGYRVDVVADGRSAVHAWQAGSYDLILMDCQMPELDGYAATAEIRRHESGRRHVPIVALTAHAMKGAGDACLEAGMDDHLSKPIDRAKLAACLDRHLNSSLGDAAKSAERRLASPDKGHLRRHHRQELNVRVQRQAGHVNDRCRDMPHIHGRFRRRASASLQRTGRNTRGHFRGRVADVDLPTGNVMRTALERQGASQSGDRVFGNCVRYGMRARYVG
jgi:CheY-like chemotaxis protein